MAGMLLAGGHVSDAVSAAHLHAGGAAPHLVFTLASVGYLAWTVVSLTQRSHVDTRRAAARLELGAMGAMFALLIVAMAFR